MSTSLTLASPWKRGAGCFSSVPWAWASGARQNTAATAENAQTVGWMKRFISAVSFFMTLQDSLQQGAGHLSRRPVRKACGAAEGVLYP